VGRLGLAALLDHDRKSKRRCAILNVHLDRLERDGFAKSQWCWGSSFDKDSCATNARPRPACLAAGLTEFPPSDEFLHCPYLKPGEALTVWGDLVADEAQPPHELSALISWELSEKPGRSV
jgi:hypothetical protein